MADDGYAVDTAKLCAHQRQISQAVASGREVLDAGEQVTPAGWDNAYGAMFQPFPQITRPVAEAIMSFAGTAIQALTETAAAVGQAAAEYQAADERVVELLRELREQIEEVSQVDSRAGD